MAVANPTATLLDRSHRCRVCPPGSAAAASEGIGRPRLHAVREIFNAIVYVVRSGCAWRLLPHEFPAWQTAYQYFQLWRLDGTWEHLNAVPPRAAAGVWRWFNILHIRV